MADSTTVGDTTFVIQPDGSIRVERAGASWWQLDRQSALHALVRDHARQVARVAELEAECGKLRKRIDAALAAAGGRREEWL